MISVCCAVYRVHEPPNVATLGAELPAALGGEDGELCVALNGVAAEPLGLAPHTRTVDLEVNRGVAPGWNAAAGIASGDVLVFANDDCRLGPGSLAALARVLRERPEAGVVGPVGTRWDLARGEHLSWVGTENEVTECDVVSGFLFACRRETFDAVGGFDEFYAPASWEEVDFCAGVLDRGLKNYVVAGVEVGHEWGISSPQRPWRRIAHNGRKELIWSIHRRNRRHFLQKWGAPAS